jgi:Protein of unknown function (DUF1236)
MHVLRGLDSYEFNLIPEDGIMLGRLLLTASFAALLSAAPATAQESQQPIYKPPANQGQATQKVIQPSAGENSDQATGNQPVPQQNQATGEAGQKTKKIQQNTQSEQPSTEQPISQAPEGQQATGESGQKIKKIQQGQQSQGSEQTTTGATGKIATDIPAEQRTVIRDKLVSQNVTRINRDKINFDIKVGIIVPTSVELAPLPADVVQLVPAYEGYLYFVLADGTIVIVEPGTLQIVTVLAV